MDVLGPSMGQHSVNVADILFDGIYRVPITINLERFNTLLIQPTTWSSSIELDVPFRPLLDLVLTMIPYDIFFYLVSPSNMVRVACRGGYHTVHVVQDCNVACW